MAVFFAVLLFLAFVVTAFIGLFIVFLAGQQYFYAPFIIIFGLGLYVFILLALFKKINQKKVLYSFLIFISLAILSVGGYEGYRAYQSNLEVVSVQDVDLYKYVPFQENTLAAKLDEESTLQLRDHLPKLDGSTALYPVYAAFVQAVYPEREYPLWDSEVMSSQTSGAYERLLSGEADIIFVPEPSDAILQQAAAQGIELRQTPVAKEAFVFFVNTGNPIESLTSDQIRSIYTGEYENWKEVGGEDKEIFAFQRPESSGSQQALQRFMGNRPIVEPTKEKVAAGMGMIIEQTAKYKNYNHAIGFSFRFFSEEVVQNGDIRHLAVDGVHPTIENIRSGSYPITSEFYAITRADHGHPHVDAFIDWILSEQGQQLVERTGYISIND